MEAHAVTTNLESRCLQIGDFSRALFQPKLTISAEVSQFGQDDGKNSAVLASLKGRGPA